MDGGDRQALPPPRQDGQGAGARSRRLRRHAAADLQRPAQAEEPCRTGKAPREIPDVDDFLANAKAQFGFTPQAPATELDYKRAYAKVASAAGLTKEACVKIYGFESGGNGKYDIQAGREYDPQCAQ